MSIQTQNNWIIISKVTQKPCYNVPISLKTIINHLFLFLYHSQLSYTIYNFSREMQAAGTILTPLPLSADWFIKKKAYLNHIPNTYKGMERFYFTYNNYTSPTTFTYHLQHSHNTYNIHIPPTAFTHHPQFVQITYYFHILLKTFLKKMSNLSLCVYLIGTK